MSDNWEHDPDLYCRLCGRYGTTYSREWIGENHEEVHCVACQGKFPEEPRPQLPDVVWTEKGREEVRRFREELENMLYSNRGTPDGG